MAGVTSERVTRWKNTTKLYPKLTKQKLHVSLFLSNVRNSECKSVSLVDCEELLMPRCQERHVLFFFPLFLPQRQTGDRFDDQIWNYRWFSLIIYFILWMSYTQKSLILRGQASKGLRILLSPFETWWSVDLLKFITINIRKIALPCLSSGSKQR